MKICVFGAASNLIDESYIKAVELLGEEIGKRGHSLVFGAGGNGLMGAAARGVKREGGEIYGVIPEFFKEEGIELIYNECTEIIYTETMSERKMKMGELADAFIIVPGGIGTFEEFFEILTLKQLGRHTKPIALYDINGYYDKMEDFLKYSVDEQFIRKGLTHLYSCVATPEEAVDYIENDKRIKYDVHEVKIG